MVTPYCSPHISVLYTYHSIADVLRGCYKGEFGVDPNQYGCHVQAGQLYCFCKGDKCNDKAVPSHSGVDFDDHISWDERKPARERSYW